MAPKTVVHKLLQRVKHYLRSKVPRSHFLHLKSPWLSPQIRSQILLQKLVLKRNYPPHKSPLKISPKLKVRCLQIRILKLRCQPKTPTLHKRRGKLKRQLRTQSSWRSGNRNFPKTTKTLSSAREIKRLQKSKRTEGLQA
jgi:hypothetical protein